MKHLVVLIAAAVAALATTASAQQPLPFYEPFDASYTNGGASSVINGVTDTGRSLNTSPANTIWNIGNSAGGGDPFLHSAAKMTYTGLGGSPSANVGIYLTNGASANRNRGFEFANTTSGALYTSFLLDVLTPPTAARPIVYLASSAQSAGGSVLGVFVNASSQLQVSKNSGTPDAATTAALTTGATNLVVMRYTWNAGTGDDEVALWLNPTSLGNDASVPAPTITATTGTDYANLSHFFISQRNNGSVAGSFLFLDEIRIATNWAGVTPTGATCNPAGVVTSPGSVSIAAGINTRLSVLGSGTSPTYQWQVSTNSGSTWGSIANATNTTYITPNLFSSDNGIRYRSLISVACNSSVATSAVATITVTNPVSTTAALIVDDYFLDGDVLAGPVATNNSVWVASTATNLTASAGVMTLTPAPSTSRLFLGYFVDTNTVTQPIDVAVGSTLKAKLVFTPTAFSSYTNGGNTLRIGLFNYADGGVRATNGFGTGSQGNGVGVSGYMAILNWGTNFTANTLLELDARTTPTDINLMGSTAGIYTQLGTGPTGTYTGTPAFGVGTNYTVELNVSRTGSNATTVTTTVSGGGLNYTYSTNDTVSAFHRFDAFGFRPNTLETTADSFNVLQFKVEVVTNAVVANPGRLTVAKSGSNVVLSWTNAAASLQVSSSVASGYSTISGATSPYTTNTTNTKLFFRLIQ